MNDTQLQNLFMIFLLRRGNGGGGQGGGRERPTGELKVEILFLGWMS